jgi:DNA-binding NtrC family response regulator
LSKKRSGVQALFCCNHVCRLSLFRKAALENGIDTAIDGLPYKLAKEQILLQFNETYVGDLLGKSNGNVTQAAKFCGLERQALQQIMRRYGIRAEQYRK